MKVMNKLFAALVLFGMSGAAFGYDFTIQNYTNKLIQVTLQVKGGSSQEQDVDADDANQISFTGKESALCLESVTVNGEPVTVNKWGISARGPVSEDEPLCENATITISRIKNTWAAWFSAK